MAPQDVILELEQLWQQRSQLEVKIIALLRAQQSQKLAKQASSKRSGAALDGGDAKRSKPMDDVERRQAELWKVCAGILKRLMSKSKALWFNKPVTAQQAPDYTKYIQHPMDMGTIQQKLKDRVYTDPSEFATDMRLVWSNCRTYNGIGTEVRTIGDQYSDDWERQWTEAAVESQWNDLLLQKDPQGMPLERKVQLSAQQLVQRVNSVTGYQFEPTREISYLERRKLSLAVAELAGEQLEMVLRIIAEYQSSQAHPDPESEEDIEVDFETLESSVAWKLFEYIDGQRKAAKPVQHKPPNKSAAPSSAPPVVPQPEALGNGQPAGPAHSHSESDRQSEEDVKGSNMVEAAHPNPGFVKNQRTVQLVDESMTGPKDVSTLQTANKTIKDVDMDADKWNILEDAPDAAPGADASAGAGDDDDLWDNFKSIAEKEQSQKAEEERKRKELEEKREREQQEAVAEARRQKEEEERKMREAEEAAAEEARRAREEARQKELEELQAQAQTAQVYIPPTTDTFAPIQSAGGVVGDLGAVGLTYKKEDDDEEDGGFDD